MLFFVNATEIRDAVVAATDAGPPHDVLLLDLTLSPDLDVPAMDAIADIHERIRRRATELWLVAATEQVVDRLELAGLTAAVGADHIFDDIAGALVAYLNTHAPSDGANAAVLADVVRAVREGRRHPHLDAAGQIALQSVERQLLEHLLPLDPDADHPQEPPDR